MEDALWSGFAYRRRRYFAVIASSDAVVRLSVSRPIFSRCGCLAWTAQSRYKSIRSSYYRAELGERLGLGAFASATIETAAFESYRVSWRDLADVTSARSGAWKRECSSHCVPMSWRLKDIVEDVLVDRTEGIGD